MLLLSAAFVLPISTKARGGDIEAGEIPIVGRPIDLPFSEASGTFKVAARAEPTSVQAEKPITLTLIVEADGRVFHPPQRIDLHQIDEFNERFYIEDVGYDNSTLPVGSYWEFTYRLKPRRADVTEIPGVPFVFYNPAIRPANKAFQVKYTDAIPIQVRSAAVLEGKPAPVADVFLQVRGGETLLARQTSWTPPGVGLIVLILVTPPLVCAAWYVVWRRRHPDVVKLRERRRSRAAQQALVLLQQAERGAADRRAELTAAALASYLAQRVELTIAEPTPLEIAAFLLRRGCSPLVVKQTAHLQQTCDAARFWPPLVAEGSKLPGLAIDVILALDADTETRNQPEIERETEAAT